jgi:ribose 5-phosphate isomerase
LSDMPGVVEHGLFIGMAKVALFARGSEIVELRR